MEATSLDLNEEGGEMRASSVSWISSRRLSGRNFGVLVVVFDYNSSQQRRVRIRRGDGANILPEDGNIEWARISEAFFDGLPRVDGGGKRLGELCSICLEQYKDGEKLVGLPCNHYFHEECISGWIFDNPKCPVCRRCLEEQTAEEKEELTRRTRERARIQCAYDSGAACCACGPGTPNSFFDEQDLNYLAIEDEFESFDRTNSDSSQIVMFVDDGVSLMFVE